MRPFPILLLPLLTGLLFAAPSVADTARAAKLEKQAGVKFDVGRFADSLRLYEQAYEEDPSPRFLLQIGECHLRLEDPEKALFYLERYVEKGTDDAKVAAVRARMDELREQLAARDEASRVKRVAVLPVDAGARGELSDQLTGLAFNALTREASVEVLDLVTTRAELADASSMGMDCKHEDMKCLTKLAILLRVDQLLVANARQTDAGETLTLVLVDALATTKLNQVEGMLPPEGPARVAAVRALVTDLLAPFVSVAGETPAAPVVDGEASETPLASVEVEGSPGLLFYSGAALVGVGGIGALVTGVAALSIDSALLFSDVGESKQERQDLLTTERVLAGVAVGGAAVAVVGGVLLGVAWME